MSTQATLDEILAAHTAEKQAIADAAARIIAAITAAGSPDPTVQAKLDALKAEIDADVTTLAGLAAAPTPTPAPVPAPPAP